MNDEIKANYYSIIPATVRYNKDLKANEKLLYGEITALSNRNGYCYAQNRYFSKLYNVSIHTVSQWVSHLQKLGYIQVELIRNSTKEIQERRIYIKDIPYIQKRTYPSVLKDTYPYVQKDIEGIYKNVQDNNINNNIDEDELFNLILNRNDKIENEFYELLKKLELLYTNEIIQLMQQDKVQVIKDIIFVLYDLYSNNFSSLLLRISRESLFSLYTISKSHSPDNLLNYYKRTIINEYTK